MPWTKTSYPVSMEKLPEEIREKAIDIGNDLFLNIEMEEGVVISAAVSRAKEWAAQHGKNNLNSDASDKSKAKRVRSGRKG